MNKNNVIDMINDLIDLTDWKTKKQINKELNDNYGVKLNEREFRKKVEEHNEMYFAHQNSFYVAHSNKGYKMTQDAEEIRKSLRDSFKRGVDQLSKYHKGIKALGENANFSLKIENNELIITEG